MLPKLDTSIKPVIKPPSIHPVPMSVYSEYLVSVFKYFKAEMLVSSKAISDLQEQFQDLKTGLSAFSAFS